MPSFPTLRYDTSLQRITYLIMAIACAALVVQYMSNPSVWRDEAALANNIIERDYTGLFNTLSYGQAAPIGFLLLTETITLFLGSSEYALRLLPFILGLLSILFFYLVGRQISPTAVVLGLALLATSQLHLRYAAEFKQYIGDSFWALFLLYLALHYINTGQKQTLFYLALCGSVAVWFSHPAVFTLASIGIILFVIAFRQHNRTMMIQLIGIGVLWLISFSIVYFISYRNVVSGTDLATMMNNYWGEKFLSLDLLSFIYAFIEIFVWVGGLSQPVMLTLVIFGFIVSLRKMKSLELALLLLPGLFMLIASLLELYPIANRMILFFIPGLMLVVATGLSQVIHSIMLSNRRIGQIMLIVCLVGILLRLEMPFITTDTTEAREALAWIHTIDPDAQLFLTGRFTQITRYYGYDFQALAANHPEDTSYWIITDSPPPPSALPEITHTVYNFKATTVICVPDNDRDCPVDVQR